MDLRTMTQSLVTLAEDNMAFFSSQGPGETARRLSNVFAGVREQAVGLEPTLGHLLGVAHKFDLDTETPANGYRSLVHTARCCLAHLLHKSRYVASNRRSIFFRASHNLAELEAYLAALTQLRALAYYAQRLLAINRPGGLFFEGDEGLTADFLQDYVTLHKGCFYGRCLGFQFTPAIRPFLQTLSIGLVSFGEHYKRNETGLSVTASSLFTGGRFAIDPELRGSEFERIIQNLDVHFWKAFWNITEIEVLSSLANMASTTVRVSRLLSLPPEAFEMPLTSDPTLTVTISPPLAHTGPGPVLARLISYDLREGQDSKILNSLAKSEGPRLELRPRPQQAPRSRALVVHIHGGGFVAQTSKSHEPYLKTWAQELGVPIISIDYSLAPEAPFPRALEECFFAYCWAVKHCALLGETQPLLLRILPALPWPPFPTPPCPARATKSLGSQASASLPAPYPWPPALFCLWRLAWASPTAAHPPSWPLQLCLLPRPPILAWVSGPSPPVSLPPQLLAHMPTCLPGPHTSLLECQHLRGA